MTDSTNPPAPNPLNPPTPPNPNPNPTPSPTPAPARPSVVASAVLVIALLLGVWGTVVSLPHFISACLQTPASAAVQLADGSPSPTPSSGGATTTNTDPCMSGEWDLSPTSFKINGAPGVLIVVIAPWIVVFAILYLIYKDKVVILADGTETEEPIAAWRSPGLIVAAIGIVLGLIFLIKALV
jgi:hypothetical protein